MLNQKHFQIVIKMICLLLITFMKVKVAYYFDKILKQPDSCQICMRVQNFTKALLHEWIKLHEDTFARRDFCMG